MFQELLTAEFDVFTVPAAMETMGENPWEKAEKSMEKDGNTEKPWANHRKNGDIVDRSWEYRGMTC